MRGRILAVLAGCLALAHAGCGAEKPGAAAYTCGYMRATTGAFREQARVLVDRRGLRAVRLSREEAVLGAELGIRRSCDGAPDADRPFRRAARGGDANPFSPPSAR
jgi:hypothetical protein